MGIWDSIKSQQAAVKPAAGTTAPTGTNTTQSPTGGVPPQPTGGVPPQPAAAPTDPWQTVYNQYRQTNPVASTQSVGGFVTALQGAGYDAKPVDHYGTPSADKVWINGAMYDLASGADSGNGTWWENPSAIPGEGVTPAEAGGGGGGNFGGYSGSSMTYSPWAPDPRNSALYDQLLGRSMQSLIPTADNPVIKSQVDAFRAEQERGSRNYLNDLAEKAGPYGNNSTEARMAHEGAAQNTAGMQAALLQNEVGARRQEIQQALTEMGGLLSDDQRLALQKELAYLSNDQFLRDLSLKAEDRASYYDLVRSGVING